MKDKPVILVVDDQPQNIELLEAYLVPHGYEIVKAANGEEALEKLSAHQIDLILLDVRMPGMDGFEVTRRVRQDNTHRLLPIILITVLRETEDRVKGIEAGCDDFISYPVDKMELVARVQSLLKVKAYNDLMSNYRTELESEVTRRTDELKHALENLQQDITERKRAEETLKKSEEKYRSIFENVQDVYYETLFDGTILEVSPSIEIISKGQYHRADLIGRSMYEFYPDAKDRDTLIKAIQKTGNVTDFEVRLKNRDGSFIPCSISAKIFFNAEGRPEKIIGSMHSLSERKQAEDVLRESETRYRSVLQSATDAIVTADSSGNIVVWNKGAERMFGYSYTEAVGQPLTSIMPLYHSTGNVNGMKILKSEVDQDVIGKTVELEGLRKDESVFPLELSLSTWGTTSGQFYTGIIRDITERKREEETLHDSREDLYRLLNSIAEGAYGVDINGNCTFVNKAFLQILGYQNDYEMLGKHIHELIHHSHYDGSPYTSSECRMYRVHQTNQPINVSDEVFWRKDGVAIPVEYWSHPIAKDGVVIGSIATFIDITERKRAEESLRETRDYLESLLSFANAPIMVWDNNNRITKFNLAFERLTGYTMYDVLGKHPEILFSDDHREKISTLISRTSDGENLISVELPVCCKDGSTRIVLWNTANIYTVDAKTITATIAHGQNITERKQAEEALRESEKRMRDIIYSVGDWVWELDENGRYVYSSKKGQDFFGYAPEYIIGKTPFDFMPPDEAERLKTIFSEIISNKAPIKDLENWNIRKDGERICLLTNGVPILDEKGNLKGYRGVDKNITERKLIEGQMRQMQKLEGLGTLAGGIAHDFNNILGIILAYITTTHRFKDDTNKLDLAVDTIVKAVERGKTLVQQILTFARKTETTFGAVDVNDVVMEIMTMIYETFPKILTYAQNFDKSVHYINADRSQLHQVLLNLCVNARDAMPSGGVLTINTRMVSSLSLRNQHPDAAASDYVCIEVSDTGEGMTEEIKERLFEPFFTTKGIGKGTGLGLSVVFGIVQTHKGFIDVESELGKGTIFRLYLPASQVEAPISVKDEQTLEEIPGGTETLLVVEDEEMLMMSLQMVLVEKGYKVLSSGNGLAALKIYQEKKNDIALVLTDLGLPTITGLEVSQRIKKINPNEHIILATGFLDPNMKSEFLKAGIQHFLYKPYDLKQVLKVVREVLDGKS